MMSENFRSYLQRAALLSIAVLAVAFAKVEAADSTSSFDIPTEIIRLPLFQSRVITLPVPASRVSVANPDLVDVVVISPTEFYLLAKDIGATNLLIWERDSKLRSTRQIEVTHDLEGLKAKLYALIPDNAIEVRSAQRSIVLSGTVPSATAMNAAIRIAEGYLAQVISRRGEQFQQESGSRREDRSVARRAPRRRDADARTSEKHRCGHRDPRRVAGSRSAGFGADGVRVLPDHP